MKVWLPYIRGGSGTDVFTCLLADALRAVGHEAIPQAFAHNFQYMPWALRGVKAVSGTDVVLANSWNGFAFSRPRLPLVVVEHHCIFDAAYTPYRSIFQALFHETLIRPFEKRSFSEAAAVVAVSAFTARRVAETFPGTDAYVIPNGVDTEFFCPGKENHGASIGRRFRLLFVGNLSERKGADLLPKIMTALGDGFDLYYTRGLRTKDPFPGLPNMHPMGRLSAEALREAYRSADALLFPSRLEGFGYAAAEAMACGTPVVASDASALPEVVCHGESGLLCPAGDVRAFADAVRALQRDTPLRMAFGRAARQRAASAFSLTTMVDRYVNLLQSTISANLAVRLKNPVS